MKSNNQQGWIKLHRSILDWEWYDEPNTFRLFTHLLIKANHKPRKYRGVLIECGQVMTGQELLAMELRLTRSKVRQSLNNLKSTNEITINSNAQGTIIEIVNYKNYQVITNETTTPPPEGNHQTTTNKTVNNYNNEIEEVIDYLNLKNNSTYRSTTPKTKTLLELRFSENFKVDDFKKVIDNKVSEWKDSDKMAKFIRPETLFGNKFESYLNQKGAKSKYEGMSNIELLKIQ